MANWLNQQKKKEVHLGTDQSKIIKSTLEDMYVIILLIIARNITTKINYVFRTKQITEMMEQIKVYKEQLGLEK